MFGQDLIVWTDSYCLDRLIHPTVHSKEQLRVYFFCVLIGKRAMKVMEMVFLQIVCNF